MQLSRLGNEIIEYYHKHDKKLQTALTDSQKKEYADPVTGTPPLYSTFSPNGFSLCSTFSADGPKDDKYGKYTFWKHGPGGKCYQFNADETLPAIPFHYF